MYTIPPPTPKKPERNAPTEPSRKRIIKSEYANTFYLFFQI